MLSTKSGTDLSTFESYIKTLPDEGEGYRIVFPDAPWQSYLTYLTLAEAKDVARQPFIYFVSLIQETGDDEETGDDAFTAIPSSQKIEKRVDGVQNLQTRLNSDQHLRVISVRNQQLVSANAVLPPYLYDPLLGKGQTIYVLDAGFNTAHTEFSTASGRTVETHVVPRRMTLAKERNTALWPLADEITDHNGHGTTVASVAGGVTHGVASKANLVLVKFKEWARNANKPTSWVYRGVTDPALDYAWEWVVKDVLEKRKRGNTGKFIVNMSYGNAPSISVCTRDDLVADFELGFDGWQVPPRPDQLPNGTQPDTVPVFPDPLGNNKNLIMIRALWRCWENDIGKLQRTKVDWSFADYVAVRTSNVCVFDTIPAGVESVRMLCSDI